MWFRCIDGASLLDTSSRRTATVRDPRSRLYPGPPPALSLSLSLSLSKVCTCFSSLPSGDAGGKMCISPPSLPSALATLQYHMGQRFRERGDCSVTLPINAEQLHWVRYWARQAAECLANDYLVCVLVCVSLSLFLGWTVLGLRELAPLSASGKFLRARSLTSPQPNITRIAKVGVCACWTNSCAAQWGNRNRPSQGNRVTR